MKHKIRKAFCLFLSLPKSIYVNVKCLPFKQAIKFPILVGHSTRIGNLSGVIELVGESEMFRLFQVRINWGGTESREEGNKGFLQVGKKGKLIFYGKAVLGKGTSVIVDRGVLTIGNEFFCNRNCCISCNDRIEIGNDAMWGWNVELLDSDNHSFSKNGIESSSSSPIIIENNVWLAAYTNVLKGTTIAEGCIVGYKSLVIGKYEEKRSLIAGSPAKIIEHNVEWKK